jgi:peroxiredoxin
MFTRRKEIAVPEVGAEAPEFNLPSAQGGQLRLSMRTAHGPVVVVFFRGVWSEEDVAYFVALSEKEDEINRARASVVGIGILEPDEAREFVRASGIKSYVLYDYVRVTIRQWGLLEKDKEHGEYARPAVFIVGSDHKIVHAWTDERPPPEEILAKISEITGLPKPAEEAEEAAAEEAAAEGGDKPKKMSAEERERIKAERRAAREAGKSVKKSAPKGKEEPEKAPEDGDKPESQTEHVPEAEKPERERTPEGEAEPGEQPEARAKSEKPGEEPEEEEE